MFMPGGIGYSSTGLWLHYCDDFFYPPTDINESFLLQLSLEHILIVRTTAVCGHNEGHDSKASSYMGWDKFGEKLTSKKTPEPSSYIHLLQWLNLCLIIQLLAFDTIHINREGEICASLVTIRCLF